MNTYTVELQRADGQLVEREYKVNWDPSKVDSSEVARACAAEATCESGKVQTEDGTHWKMPHAPLKATLQPA